jgi:hypothetical protein
VVFFGSICWGHCLCCSILEGEQRCPGRARGTCRWQCQDALTG